MNKRQISALKQLHDTLTFSVGWGDAFANMHDVEQYREWICEKRSGNDTQAKRYDMMHAFVCVATACNGIDITSHGVSPETFMKNAYKSQLSENRQVIDRELYKIDCWLERFEKLFI